MRVLEMQLTSRGQIAGWGTLYVVYLRRPSVDAISDSAALPSEDPRTSFCCRLPDAMLCRAMPCCAVLCCAGAPVSKRFLTPFYSLTLPRRVCLSACLHRNFPAE